MAGGVFGGLEIPGLGQGEVRELVEEVFPRSKPGEMLELLARRDGRDDCGGVRRGSGLRGAGLADDGRLAGGRCGEAHGRGRSGLVPVRAMPHGHEALRHAAGNDVREVQEIVQGGQERLELRVPEFFLAHAGVHERFRDGCHGDGLVEWELGGKRAVNALACRERDGRGHGQSFRRVSPLYGRMTACGGAGARMGRDAPCLEAGCTMPPCSKLHASLHTPYSMRAIRRASVRKTHRLSPLMPRLAPER